MQVSQSTPGMPVAGISCSGVPKSPSASSESLKPPMPPRCTSTRLLTMIFGSSLRHSSKSFWPRSWVQVFSHSPSNHSTPGS